MAEGTKRYYCEPDYVRSICVIYIVCFWHMVSYTDISGFKNFRSQNNFEQITYCVLACFMIISGFFAYREYHGFKDVLKYYAGRFLRLWPLFAIAEIAMVFLGINDRQMLPYVLCGLGWLKKPYPLTLWFAGVIFLFWLLSPLLSMKKWQISAGIAVTAEVIFVALSVFFTADERLYFYWPFFAAGCFFGKLIREKDFRITIDTLRGRIITVAISLTCIALSVLISFITDSKDFKTATIPAAVLFIAGWFLFFHVLHCKFTDTIARHITYASMCMYLFHRVFFDILCRRAGFKVNSVGAWILAVLLIFTAGYAIQFLYDFLTGLPKKVLNPKTEKELH